MASNPFLSRTNTGDRDAPASSSKYHHPYFTPAEVEFLSEKQRGKLSATREDKERQRACAFIESVGAKTGFPRRTIATAQNLYHRLHLFFPRKHFDDIYDVCLAALYVSTKMHDTLKKPRDLLFISYAVRFPALAAQSTNPSGALGADAINPQTVESDRQKLLAVERLILETICFNFTSRMPFPYVIKIGRVLGATKQLTKYGWRLAVDAHRTLIPIQYPPHIVALGSIYTAALLTSFEVPEPVEVEEFHSAHYVAKNLGKKGEWEEKFHTQVEDLEEIAHAIIDLMIHCINNTSTTDTSPRTPSSPSPHPSPRHPQLSTFSNGHGPQQPVTAPYKADQLIRLKIAMRETEHPPRSRQPLGSSDPSSVYGGEDVTLIGRTEGTVRFLFGPPGTGDAV